MAAKNRTAPHMRRLKNTMKFFIGIDPGIGGAIAVLDETGHVFSVIPMPVAKVGAKNKLDLRSIRLLFKSYDLDKIQIVAIERQQAFPKQGAVSCFTIGMGYGQLEGLCAGLNIPYTIIGPRDWQKEMYMGLPKGKSKDHSILMAQRLFPKTSFLATSRCTKIHDGMTDAILIAEYGRRKHK